MIYSVELQWCISQSKMSTRGNYVSKIEEIKADQFKKQNPEGSNGYWQTSAWC